MKLIVKTLMGLEDVLEKELKSLGAKETIAIKRAVIVKKADKELMYKLNYSLRTGLRVLQVIDERKITSFQDLYNEIYHIPWYDYFDLTKSFAIDAVSSSQFFKNSLFVAQKSKDAIVDKFRDKYRRRPDINTKQPDVLINIHVRDRLMTISLDASGSPLFKRGYRKMTGRAPLNEVLAAGMIQMSGWDHESPFIDPMCGSGTIAIEAFMLANKVPAQLKRNNFSFMNWLDFEPKIWMGVRRDAVSKMKLVNRDIFAKDYDSKMIDIARTNFLTLNVDGQIRFEQKDFFESIPDRDQKFIMFNPPYDKRLETDDVMKFYKQIGDYLKHNYKDKEVWIISGSMEGMSMIGLKSGKKHKLQNGSIDSWFNQYELY